MATAADVRPGDPDPYPDLRWLRTNHPVLNLGPAGAGSSWLVTGHQLARECLTDPRLSLDERGALPPSAQESGRTVPRGIMSLDGPEHLRLRKLMATAFRANVVGGYRDAIERLCQRTIDRFVADGETDLVTAYTLPIPVGIVYEILGTPESLRLPPARCFALFYELAWTVAADPAGASALLDHLVTLIADKRDNPGDDLLSSLLAEVDRGVIRDEDELVGLLLTFMDAGHVSTIQFLGTAILHLLRRPVLRDGLLSGAVPWQGVVTELLRIDSPAQQSVVRYAVEDLRIDGVPIAKGDRVTVSLAGANRDERVFPDPDEFRPDRDARAQLGFGHGPHMCVGAHLLRLETEVALTALFRRLDGVRLTVDPDEIPWDHGPTLRGPRALPVVFTPGRAHVR